MPGEPCGKDTCISYEELEKLRRNARIGVAVKEFLKFWQEYSQETEEQFRKLGLAYQRTIYLSELEDVILRAEKGEFKNE